MSPHASGSGACRTAPDPLPIDVVDNHVHLDITREGDEPLRTWPRRSRRARAVGVTRLVQVGCDLEGIRFTMDAIERHTEVSAESPCTPTKFRRLAAAGTARGRPTPRWSGARPTTASASSARPASTTTAPVPRACRSSRTRFRWHIDLAKRLGKALQIHDRDAHDDVLRVLEEEGAPEHTVLHCFSGDLAMARECVERGYYLSFAGHRDVQERPGAARRADRDPARPQLLVETDAPYLTPVAAPGCDQRVVPRAAYHSGHGWRAQHRRADPLPGGVRELREGLRTVVVSGRPHPLHRVMGPPQERYRNLTSGVLIIQSG